MHTQPSTDAGGRVFRFARTWMAAALAAALLAPAGRLAAQDMPQPPNATSLYHRMGGYDTIASVVDDFIKQLGKDPAFKRFGGGRSFGSLVRTRQLIVDQLCNLTGGPCVYFGRDMKDAHKGLGITNAEWDSAVDKIKSALDDQKVAAPEQKEFLGIIAKFKSDIVQPPAEKPQEEAPKTQN